MTLPCSRLRTTNGASTCITGPAEIVRLLPGENGRQIQWLRSILMRQAAACATHLERNGIVAGGVGCGLVLRVTMAPNHKTRLTEVVERTRIPRSWTAPKIQQPPDENQAVACRQRNPGTRHQSFGFRRLHTGYGRRSFFLSGSQAAWECCVWGAQNDVSFLACLQGQLKRRLQFGARFLPTAPAAAWPRGSTACQGD